MNLLPGAPLMAYLTTDGKVSMIESFADRGGMPLHGLTMDSPSVQSTHVLSAGETVAEAVAVRQDERALQLFFGGLRPTEPPTHTVPALGIAFWLRPAGPNGRGYPTVTGLSLDWQHAAGSYPAGEITLATEDFK
jgi:hypothetical protein